MIRGFTLRTYTHLMPAAHDRMRQAIDAASAQDHGPATAQEDAMIVYAGRTCRLIKSPRLDRGRRFTS